MEGSETIDSRTGVVVIGRNEGERLTACLRSVAGFQGPCVYVDSGSIDDSVERARRQGVRVIVLDPARPFSAARARNEGFANLLAACPSLSCVQFLDGDCILQTGWVDHAAAALDADPRCAVVIGRLEELHPEASIYNRMCAMEWRSPPGDLVNFGALGGIMMVRAQVFTQLGGFDEHVIAGEDSELGVRVTEAGSVVRKIDEAMAIHDADMRRFHQWWKRAVRGGHAIGQRFSLHGRGPLRDCARERRSVLLWGVALPATMGLTAPATYGASLLLAAGYWVLARRVIRYRMSRGDSVGDARLYSRFVILGKFAEAVGLVTFHINRLVGRYRIIEYK